MSIRPEQIVIGIRQAQIVTIPKVPAVTLPALMEYPQSFPSPFWAGLRSCTFCQHEGCRANNSFFELQECPLTIPNAHFLHQQVHMYGACIWWKHHYINHCWNCKAQISSKVCRRSTNRDMGYICNACGKDLTEYRKGRVLTFYA